MEDVLCIGKGYVFVFGCKYLYEEAKWQCSSIRRVAFYPELPALLTPAHVPFPPIQLNASLYHATRTSKL